MIKLNLDNIGDFLSKYAENSEHVYWISSPDLKKIKYICQSYEKIWGRPRQELYENPDLWISFLHPEDASHHHPIQELAKKIVNEGEKARYQEDYRIIRPDGSTRWILDRGFPLIDEKGRCYGVTGIAIDVTDQKQQFAELKKAKEEAEAANQAKTEFLENMRHDIRTPLTGIVGFSDIIKTESQSLQIKEYAENLIASSHALLDLMDEVLEAVRVSSGEIPKAKKKFSLEKTLNHVIDLNRAKAASKRLDLSIDYDDNIPKYVIGDNIRIHRVALELVANALNFTDSGLVKLIVKLAKHQNRELIIRIIVHDSGMGIPPEKQQEIFLQFKRLTPSYKGLYKGAGLGLSVIKQFIDDINGEIYVESTLHKGSTFTCILPLQEPLLDNDEGVNESLDFKSLSEESGAVPRSIMAAFDNTTHQGAHRVLVVEDNPIAQTVTKSMLSQFDCQVDVASDGHEALDRWKKNDYDLIFMDIGLPDMDGYEVTHHIRVQEIAKKNHTPIIALTAHAGDENKQRCIEAGMNAVLTKPLTQKGCADVLDSFILSRKQEKAINTNNYAFDLPDNDKALFELSDFPMLDINEGIKATSTEVMLVKMLKLMVKQSLPDDVLKMKEAHDTGDWEKTQALAHKIKGGSVCIGAIRIKMACQYFERYWKTGRRDLLEQLYQQILTVIEDSEKQFIHWLEKH